jgi:hypothetical protein
VTRRQQPKTTTKTTKAAGAKKAPPKRKPAEPTKVVKKTDDEIIEAYEKWDPTSSRIEDFARTQGISKPQVYAVLTRQGVVPKTRRGGEPGTGSTKEHLDRIEGKLDLVLDKVGGNGAAKKKAAARA